MRAILVIAGVIGLASAAAIAGVRTSARDDHAAVRRLPSVSAQASALGGAADDAEEEPPAAEVTTSATSAGSDGGAPLREGSPGCGSPVASGDSLERLDTDQGVRSYRRHLPEAYREGIPTALVLNFHGFGRSAAEQERYSQLVPVSDRAGFILVTPEGSGSPAGWDIPGVYAENGYDDVGFVLVLLGQLEADLCIDPVRVFATGLSNGAEMASLMACRQPALFAAIAPVAGVIYSDCDEGAVPVIAFHGTLDYNIPFEFAPPSLASWAAHNGCEPGMHDRQVSDNVTAWEFAGCGGADVALYAVDGGGHTWPGAEDNAGGAGPTTHEIDASELIWAFFDAHPKAR